MPSAKDDLETRFTYHPPHGDQPQRYNDLREKFKSLAYTIVNNTPESREQSLALTALEEACFWTNAAIARREVKDGE